MTIPYSVGILSKLKRLFVHLPDFDHFWTKAGLGDDELKDFQNYLLEYPKQGVVISGSNGIRKIRWKKKGTGKSGGIRVFYVDFEEFEIVFLITLLEKNDKENLTKSELTILYNLVARLKEILKSGKHPYGKRK